MAQVRDPGNVGTVIRVADAAGADGVVCSTGTADPWNTKTVRAAAGSSFHLPLAADIPLGEAIVRGRDCGMTVLAADARGVGLFEKTDLDRPTLWVLGNEAWGLPAELLDSCDEVVAIPIYGRAESLNLATAAAVCLYVSAQAQHRTGTAGDPH
jgi:TrmH family RNA methyltransferase